MTAIIKLYRQTEEKYGKPMSKLLPERLAFHKGVVQEVAREFGVTRVTLWRWMGMAGCQSRRILVPAEVETAPDDAAIASPELIPVAS